MHMEESNITQEIEQLQQKIEVLTSQLVDAKKQVSEWTEANQTLSLNAAEARAKNQNLGRGFLGGLLGPKYRRVVRAGAAASNAVISRDVAQKRARIAEGKRDAQDVVRQIQAELIATKKSIKELSLVSKNSMKKDVSKKANDSLDLLQKLKDAREAGLLTQEEFEEKRKKLVTGI
jgi:cell division septum initiation protein DivIVA